MKKNLKASSVYRKILFIFISVFLLNFFTHSSYGDHNPNTTNMDPPRAGGPLPGLTPIELEYFNSAREIFSEKQSVTGTEPGADDAGLGPRFNLNSCAGCHIHPSIGGTSPAINPQVEMATHYGARNTVPSFITINGPIREARFKFRRDGKRDGGVQNIFVITGRFDAPGCNISQPNFEEQLRRNNVIFRIPTPLFGTGLIEAIPDQTILDNKNSFANLKATLGISGHENRTVSLLGTGGLENRNGNDGTITRFGWKAQNKSLTIFSGEAYNVEQGVTNELFQDEREGNPSCQYNTLPESQFNLADITPFGVLSDVTKFSIFMRFLAPPTPKPFTESANRGKELFSSVGCALCHTPTMKTGPSVTAAFDRKDVDLYSDLLVHSMGPGLADHIEQEFAGPDDFRTAPLWGLSQRLFFLHDGRTSDLTEAILAHASTNSRCREGRDRSDDGVACRSEANEVIRRFKDLSRRQKADLLEFLNSL